MNHARKLTRLLGVVTILLTLTLSLAPISQGRAAEFGTGIYVLGYQSALAGYQPDPGFYLRNDLYVYQGNATIIPFSKHVEVDLRNRLITDMIGATYVTPLEIFGAHYAVGMIWSSATNN